MITLPTGLNAFMKGQKLDGLKPFALLYRNKWDSVNNKYALEDIPIDISALIVKPNTLSMTLDVNEVAQYNANNVTLTLSDTKNYFVEGTPNSYFPDGYQIYGSRVVLYYGTDGVNRTPLFTGVIKDLPTHKPENYQVDVKLVSPLEMLKDIEAKDFSDKVIGEELHYEHQDDDSHRIYSTAGTGVGGFDAVYADGNKLFEGVDYETDQMNALGLPALVTIINDDLQNATITADYYTWKTGLTVEQVVAGLIALAGYDSGNENIDKVIWESSVRSRFFPDILVSFQFKKDNSNLTYGQSIYNTYGTNRNIYFGNYFKVSFDMRHVQVYGNYYAATTAYTLGNNFDTLGIPENGIYVYYNTDWRRTIGNLYVLWRQNGQTIYSDIIAQDLIVQGPVHCEITLNNGSYTVYLKNASGDLLNATRSFSFNNTNEGIWGNPQGGFFENYKLDVVKDNITYAVTDFFTANGFLTAPYTTGATSTLVKFLSYFSSEETQYNAFCRYSQDLQNWSEWQSFDIGATLSQDGVYFQFYLVEKGTYSDISNICFDVLSSSLKIQLVNLSGLTVLEALQDFALISGYEFGVDRNGVFFFRPRVASTTPTYILDHDQIVKVDTVKKNLSDFFTKLTLTFAQVPLEFYANSGPRPTLVDKYGVINKEIDKPDIVNYDNPELAQAIGPQLLEVYSSLPNIIQVTGKLNLALELGDIVSLRRNMNLITPDNYTDYSKYTDLNTYYRACKITGMNYNFAKRQITYTLRDVSNKNTEPQYEFNEYIYDYQVQFGVKE